MTARKSERIDNTNQTDRAENVAMSRADSVTHDACLRFVCRVAIAVAAAVSELF